MRDFISRLFRYRCGYLIKPMVYLAIAAVLIILILRKELVIYVHPRLLPWLIASAVFSVLMAAASVQMAFVRRYRYREIRAEILVLPFLLALLLAVVLPVPQASAVSRHKNTGISRPLKERIHDSKVKILDTEFYAFTNLLFDERDVLNGKEIDYTIFVHYDDKMKKNEFMGARMVMVCCAADMIPNGMMIRMDHEPEWEEGTWLRVRGILHYGKPKNEFFVEPYLQLEEAEECERPIYDIVYPDF